MLGKNKEPKGIKMSQWMIMAFDANGNQMWLNGPDLDSRQVVFVEGVAETFTFMKAVKSAHVLADEGRTFTAEPVDHFRVFEPCGGKYPAHMSETWARIPQGLTRTA